MELGDLQLSVMEIVWSASSANAAEVHQILVQDRDIAYTTVLSTLQGLERRQVLRRSKEGRAHRYFPQLTRHQYTGDRVEHLVRRLFAGRPEELMSHLLGRDGIQKAELDRIQRMIDEEKQ